MGPMMPQPGGIMTAMVGMTTMMIDTTAMTGMTDMVAMIAMTMSGITTRGMVTIVPAAGALPEEGETTMTGERGGEHCPPDSRVTT